MYTLYWYPKCSTCQKAKAWLDTHHVDYRTKDLVQTPPSAEELTAWITKSGLPLKRFFNTSGIKYRELDLKEQVPSLSISDGAKLLASDGMLIKRPLLLKNNQVVAIGFKDAAYEGVLHDGK